MSEDLHLCHDLPGADLHLGETCPYRPTPDLHLGYPLPGVQLTLGLPAPQPSTEGVSLELAAVAPTPIASALVNAPAVVAVSATAPAPVGHALAVSPRRIEIAATAPAPSSTASVLVGQRVTVSAQLPAPTASGLTVSPAPATLSAVAPAPATIAAIAGPAPATVVAFAPPPLAMGLVAKLCPLTVSAFAPQPIAGGAVAKVSPLELSARAPAPIANMATAYDPNLLSDTVSVVRSVWSEGVAAQAQMRFPFTDAKAAQASAAPTWAPAEPVRGGTDTRWSNATPASGSGFPSWSDATPAPATTETRWNEAAYASAGADTRWNDGDSASNVTRTGWIQLYLLTASMADDWQDAPTQSASILLPFADGTWSPTDWETRWNDAGYPLHRFHPRPPIPPVPWIPLTADLCLIHPLPGTLLHLGLGCPAATVTIVIPIRRIYRVINTVTLTRVSDGAEIPARRLTLSVDNESWSWLWNCAVPGAALSMIVTDGQPEELLATINGQGVRLLIDSVSRSREFGKSEITVSGRGRAAMLAAPTAFSISRKNIADTTAQQILDDALTDNGISIGWDVDWQIENWQIPSGAWVQTGTYIYAAMRIARSGGGYVQSHDTDKTLIIKPDYPVLPWDWADATPDLILPEDVCRTEGVEWVELAEYNAVWVTGGDAVDGRRDYIRRAGTDGLLMADTVVNSLATDAIMTRQVGASILANTGKQMRIRVKLPVLALTGIIKPGLLVDYTEQGIVHRGITRAVTVECGMPDTWQTITIEARA